MSPNTALININVQIFAVDGPGTFCVHFQYNIYYILCCTIKTLLNKFCLFCNFFSYIIQIDKTVCKKKRDALKNKRLGDCRNILKLFRKKECLPSKKKWKELCQKKTHLGSKRLQSLADCHCSIVHTEKPVSIAIEYIIIRFF